jgi:hypothetical protein
MWAGLSDIESITTWSDFVDISDFQELSTLACDDGITFFNFRNV